MLFMVEFQLKPGTKNAAINAFELRGPNRNPGVTFRGAWVGAKADVGFVLVESDDESLIKKAGEPWPELGGYQIHQVIDVQQY